jgi:glutathione S-transferase
VLSRIPAPVRAVIAPLARDGVKKQLRGHGLGLHSADEIAGIARRDIDALAAVLADQPFFFGDAPSEADATVYGLLANIVKTPFESPMKAMIAGHASLAGFVDRFRDAVY